MSNVLRRLVFWKRRKQGKARGKIIPGSGFLRDFIYLDVVLVSSYLEQLTGGVPQEARVSQEYRGGGQAGVNMPLFQLNVQGGGSWGYQENQTIYWDRYARLEEELRDAGKLVEVVGTEPSTADLKPNTIFLVSGCALFEPDWSNWQSGMSMAKLVIDKLRQVSALEVAQQEQPNASGMVPLLYEPSGEAVVMVKKDALSQLIPDNLPNEPPNNIRRLFKPSGIKIVLHIGISDAQVALEGIALLQHFTPHQVERYLLGRVEEDIHVLGLVRQRKGATVQFIPLSVFVRI